MAGWQAILGSIATSLRTDSVFITSSLVFLVIFAIAIALYLKFTVKEEPMIVRMKAGALQRRRPSWRPERIWTQSVARSIPSTQAGDRLSSRCFKRQWRRCSNPRVRQPRLLSHSVAKAGIT